MVEINFEAPKVQEYCDLRVNAGMSPKSIEAAEKGLPNACFN
ncbi:GNAT family N-acetyltransferase, partial [Staphylococcus epidermidis]